MRRKNLGLKVAALAVTGTIAVSPMTVRAEEGTANTAVSAPAPSGTTATTPAVTGAASTSAASTTTPAASTTATTTATTTTTATATPAAPVSFAEPAADPGTTAPNNVDTVVPDDTMQGTDIHFKADGEVKKTISFLGFTSEIKIPVHKDYNAEIKPEDTKEDKKLKDTVQKFKNTDLGKLKNNDLVMHGDLSIQKEDDTTPFDSTNDKAKDVEKTDTYTLKADLDVSPVHKLDFAQHSPWRIIWMEVFIFQLT